jgi:hypothetical protein
MVTARAAGVVVPHLYFQHTRLREVGNADLEKGRILKSGNTMLYSKQFF